MRLKKSSGENRLEEENKGEILKKREKGVELGIALGLWGLPVFHVRTSSPLAVTHNVTPLRGSPLPAKAPPIPSSQSPSYAYHTAAHAPLQVAAIRRTVNVNSLSVPSGEPSGTSPLPGPQFPICKMRDCIR